MLQMAQCAKWWVGESVAFSQLLLCDIVVRLHTAAVLLVILCSDSSSTELEQRFGGLYFAEHDEWRDVVEFWFKLVFTGRFLELFPWKWVAT
jgi:hypothetical protein